MPQRCIIAAAILMVSFTTGFASDAETQSIAFIHGMLKGLRTETVPCPGFVQRQTEEHAMQAFCARYGGDFEAFESDWRLHTLRDRVLKPRDDSGFQALPLTEWVGTDDGYERIYSIGTAILGVRYDKGHLLMVYR